MVGGLGLRLRPLTDNSPKPMLPVGERPLLEHTIERMRRAGLRTVHLITHYKSEVIQAHFVDGAQFGVDIRYAQEPKPMGTAGGLRLLRRGPTYLVVNGDVLTNIDYRGMIQFHQECGAALTLATLPHSVEIPFGVVECEGSRVTNLREKPRFDFRISAGIYVLEPDVLDHIPDRVPFDMTDLIEQLLVDNRHVASFPLADYWMDIGTHPQYEKAQQDVRDLSLGPTVKIV